MRLHLCALLIANWLLILCKLDARFRWFEFQPFVRYTVRMLDACLSTRMPILGSSMAGYWFLAGPPFFLGALLWVVRTRKTHVVDMQMPKWAAPELHLTSSFLERFWRRGSRPFIAPFQPIEGVCSKFYSHALNERTFGTIAGQVVPCTDRLRFPPLVQHALQKSTQERRWLAVLGDLLLFLQRPIADVRNAWLPWCY